jgi:hypothetical protein
MALLRKISALRLSPFLQQQSGSGSLLQRFAFSAQPAPEDNPFYHVPEGHQNSDLSSEACHIGLSRRKDLTLRQDIRLMADGEPKSLAELLKVGSSATACTRSPSAAARSSRAPALPP